MKQMAVVRIGLFIIAALVLGACAAGQQQYKTAMQLSQSGKYQEAIAYLEAAIAKEPGNQQYRSELAAIKNKLVGQYVSDGRKALGPPSAQMRKSILDKAKVHLAKARKIAPEHPETRSFSDAVQRAEKALLDEVKKLYADAKNQMDAGDYHKAHFNLQQIQRSFPNYEDSSRLLIQASTEGARDYFAKGKALFDKEDFAGATEMLRKSLSLKSDQQGAREMLSLAKARDSKEYFVSQGRKAVSEKQWDRAAQMYQRAQSYSPGDAELGKLIAQVKERAGHYYIDLSRVQMSGGYLLRAFQSYDLSIKYHPNASDFKLTSLRQDLSSRAGLLASQLKDRSHFGSAWFWYKKIAKINPNFPNLFYLSQEMEDKIRQRVRKAIAVFDFNSPSEEPDAGIIVANNLITYLFKTASQDIKILERENLKSILEEMKLGQIGVVSANSAKEMGRVYGIDVAIMGSVLVFNVDSTSSEGSKTVRYKIGTKIEDNIEFLNWIAKHPNPNKEELKKAPPAKVIEPEFAEREYKVSQHKKIGFVQLSFRIVDVATGENIQVKTIERKEVAEDTGSAGLKEANVKYDPVEIPTDTEMLQKMTEEIVAELGREALRPMQNLEKTYFQEAEALLRRRDQLSAAERFCDALFDLELKRIPSSPLHDAVDERLEKIFYDYRANI